jgi:hypothetical protein
MSRAPEPFGFPQGYAGEFASLRRLARIAAETVGDAAPFDDWHAQLLGGAVENADSTLAVETRLEDLTRELRRICLGLAHGMAERSLRSPLAADTGEALHGRRVDFGYERGMAPEALEQRLGTLSTAIPGWRATHRLCSSGQAAMAVLVNALMAAHAAPPLRLLHMGTYFETAELMRLLGRGGQIDYRLWQPGTAPEPADVVLLEPVYLRANQLAFIDLNVLADVLQRTRPRHIVIDATLVGPLLPLADILRRVDASTTLTVLRSCLKLDQAGLELANAGSLGVYAQAASETEAGTLLQHIDTARGLFGAGLSFEAINALSYPWCFARRDWQAYCARVFRHNRQLSAVIAQNDFFLSPWSGAATGDMPRWAQAPFCCLRPRDLDIDCDAFAQALQHRASEMDAKLDRGGSFGFRGHRFDLIEPADGTPAFVRIAMGARGGGGLAQILKLLSTFIM